MTDEKYPQLAVSQFESLRQEILLKANEAGNTLRFGIISSGAIWTWLATNQKITSGYELVVWVPAFLVALLAFLYWCLRSDIKLLSLKIASIEKDFHLPDILCWESNWKQGKSRAVLASWSVWSALFIGNIMLAITNA